MPQSGVGLDESLGLNLNICKPGGPKCLNDLADERVIGGNLVFTEELLHERAMAFKHDVPFTVVRTAQISLRIASNAHKIGGTLVFSLVGPAEVLHANDVC